MLLQYVNMATLYYYHVTLLLLLGLKIVHKKQVMSISTREVFGLFFFLKSRVCIQVTKYVVAYTLDKFLLLFLLVP